MNCAVVCSFGLNPITYNPPPSSHTKEKRSKTKEPIVTGDRATPTGSRSCCWCVVVWSILSRISASDFFQPHYFIRLVSLPQNFLLKIFSGIFYRKGSLRRTTPVIRNFRTTEQGSTAVRPGGSARMIIPGSGDVRNEHHYEAIAYLITWLVAYLFG